MKPVELVDSVDWIVLLVTLSDVLTDEYVTVLSVEDEPVLVLTPSVEADVE